MKILEIMRIEKYFKEMGKMKYLRVTIIGIVVSSVIFSVAFIAIKQINSHGSMNHNVALNSKSSESAKNDNLKSDNSNLNTVPDDVTFVKYTVRANDTLWGISDTYMPEYNAYPEGDKEGVIAFIVKENNLQKGNNSEYIIYSGQNLTIPKQKNIDLATNYK